MHYHGSSAAPSRKTMKRACRTTTTKAVFLLITPSLTLTSSLLSRPISELSLQSLSISDHSGFAMCSFSSFPALSAPNAHDAYDVPCILVLSCPLRFLIEADAFPTSVIASHCPFPFTFTDARVTLPSVHCSGIARADRGLHAKGRKRKYCGHEKTESDSPIMHAHVSSSCSLACV